jgi:DNA invertase Pin-like site-specific DNA recombinase
MQMRTIAYIRVSTGSQDLDSQRLAILDYAHRQGLTVDTFVEAQVSSRRAAARRGLDAVLEQVQPGDLIVVSELSRLGRSVGQIIQLVDCLMKQRVQLVAIKEHIQLNGTQDIQTKVMITMFGLFAEIERDLIAERTKEGLAAARAKGRLPGRPKGVLGTSKLTGREAEIQTLLAKTVSKASIAKIMGVSRSTLQHFLQSRRLV